ncbi:MAG: GAF domain-containing protein [Actinomycetota bacterium]
MSAHLKESQEILGRLQRALAPESEPQAIVNAIVPELRTLFPLFRITIRRLVDDVMLEITGLWNAGPTSLGVGAKMSVMSSSFPAIASTGKPVVRSRLDRATQLLEGLVGAEGVASYVTLPLRSGDVVTGLLSLSSAMPGAFTEQDVPFFEEVASLVGSRLSSAGG